MTSLRTPDQKPSLMKTHPSDDPIIASYQYQTQQIKDMKWVLVTAIAAGTSLMIISVIAPYFIITFLHTFVLTPANETQAKMIDTIQALVNTPRDVLPLATGLVGFAGGVVTAMFRSLSQSPPGQVPPRQARPTANNIAVSANRNKPVEVTLTGTPSTPGDVLKFSVVGLPLHGTVTMGGASNIVTYTPKVDYTGPDSFTYKVTSQGVDSDPATVSITVT